MNDQPQDNATSSTSPAVPPRKRRWLKRMLVAGVGTLVILAVLALVGILWIDHLAKAGIELAGTRALGVATTLDRLKLGLFSGNSTLGGLQLGNPPGYRSEYFLRLDDGALDLSLRNLLNETVEIDRLTLSGIHVNLVREKPGLNCRTIIDHIRKLQAGDEAKADSGKKFVIHEVVLKDIRVNIDLLPIGGKLTQLDVPIPELILKNVGSEDARGENLTLITATVVRALLEAVIVKAEGMLPPEVVDELGQMLSELKPLETLRNIRENIRERREERRENGEGGGLLEPLRRRREERRQQRRRIFQ